MAPCRSGGWGVGQVCMTNNDEGCMNNMTRMEGGMKDSLK